MMFGSVTRILLKTFVADFYKAHAGVLLTLFVTVFINFFFTNVLNQTHLNKEQILLNNLKLVLTSVSNPVAMGVLFAIWLGYTIKSCQFVSAQLVLSQNQFLFYSSTSLSLRRQFQTWFIIQTIILLPILALGFFAVGVGIKFNYVYIPFFIPVYLFLLISGSAFYCIRVLNSLDEKQTKSYVLFLLKGYPKPLFSLFLYQIIYRYKIHYVISKGISVVTLVVMHMLFRDNPNDIRISGVSMLGVILSHTFLIYLSNEFDRSYLGFARNFPLSNKSLYLQLVAQYFLLLLPEIICLFYIHLKNVGISFKVSLLGLSCALLFRSILYGQCQQMGRYLKVVFGLFILSALLVIYGAFWWLTAVNLAVSFFLFHRSYPKSLD